MLETLLKSFDKLDLPSMSGTSIMSPIWTVRCGLPSLARVKGLEPSRTGRMRLQPQHGFQESGTIPSNAA